MGGAIHRLVLEYVYRSEAGTARRQRSLERAGSDQRRAPANLGSRNETSRPRGAVD
jgi:hypothetical protein